MKQFLLPAVTLSVSIFALSVIAPVEAYAGGAHRNNYTASETYMVIKVGDEYKVVPTSRLKDEEKRVKDEYAEKLKEWQDLRRIDPGALRPQKVAVKKIKTGYLTQKIAQEYADKLRDEAADKDNGDKNLAEIRK